MTNKIRFLAVCALSLTPLMATQVLAQTQPGMPAMASPCPPGTQYVPPGRDGAGNPVGAYCAMAPTGQGAYDPYTGRGVADPQGYRGGGPTQVIPPTR